MSKLDLRKCLPVGNDVLLGDKKKKRVTLNKPEWEIFVFFSDILSKTNAQILLNEIISHRLDFFYLTNKFRDNVMK